MLINKIIINNVGSAFTDRGIFRREKKHIPQIWHFCCISLSYMWFYSQLCCESNECWISVFVSNVAVKDRYGDQDEENSSESSDSDSDESEVVQYSLTCFLFETLYPDDHVQYSDECIYRSWTQSWTEIFTERCHCWRRKIQRSIRKMPNSTQKRVWWLHNMRSTPCTDMYCMRRLCCFHVSCLWINSTWIRQRWSTVHFKKVREAHVPEGLWEEGHPGERRVRNHLFINDKSCGHRWMKQ